MAAGAEAARDPMLPAPWRVARVRRETADTFTLDLVPGPGVTAPPFHPGQFNMLYVLGTGEVPISISGDPAEPRVLRHTTRVVGAVTRAMGALGRGGMLGLRGPFGSAWPVEEAEGGDVVLIAGGIGLAPLRPALYRLMARRSHYGRVVLAYGTRTPTDILYRGEVARWRARADLDVLVTVDRAAGAWPGKVGVVTALIRRAPFDPRATVALVCGPEVMMRFAVEALRRRGVPPARIYLSMERNMKCAVGLCGHCQLGPEFVCKDGPVFRLDRIARLFEVPEI
jgi:NAD(P)H-flavin reductase